MREEEEEDEEEETLKDKEFAMTAAESASSDEVRVTREAAILSTEVWLMAESRIGL